MYTFYMINCTALQSNSLLGFNMVYRNEDSILDQIYAKQIFSAFYYEDLKV